MAFQSLQDYNEQKYGDWFVLLAENGIRTDIINVGTYWYDNPKTKTNGEFDVAIETIDGFDIYEVKFLSSPMTDDLIKEETRKIRSINGINVSSIGFVSSSGFEHPAENCISGEDIFSIK